MLIVKFSFDIRPGYQLNFSYINSKQAKKLFAINYLLEPTQQTETRIHTSGEQTYNSEFMYGCSFLDQGRISQEALADAQTFASNPLTNRACDPLIKPNPNRNNDLRHIQARQQHEHGSNNKTISQSLQDNPGKMPNTNSPANGVSRLPEPPKNWSAPPILHKK
jgi:hypothetical protein